MKKTTSYLSRFIALALLIPHIGFALDERVQSSDSIENTLSPSDTAAIDAKSVPLSTESFSENSEQPVLDKNTVPEAPASDAALITTKNSSENIFDRSTSTQGALSAADTALGEVKIASESPFSELKKTGNQQDAAETIEFNYVNEDIITIINSLATKKGVNVIIPLGANALTNKVTLSLPNRITLDEAWAFLQTFLDLSGYAMIPRGDMYYITKKSGTVAKEPLPLFVGMKPSELPDTDERIRYIYYLSNIKVSDAPDSELALLLKDLLPQPDGAFKMDPPSNGLIMSARSREIIKSLMEIIIKLDKVGFLEKFEIFRLRFTNATKVADIFNKELLKTDLDPNRYRLDTKRTTDATYFSKFTRIIPDARTNSLIILGRFQAIERIKEFIRQYIDIKIETGKSPIHVYNLQYLKAEDIALVLEKILKEDTGEGTGQSQVGATVTGGIQRSFGEVKILSDTPIAAAAQAGTTEATASHYYGGNKLIIACSNDAWKEIEKLIQSLDQPRPQVLIEVLIADLEADDFQQLGTSICSPGKFPGPSDINFQTTHLGNNFITDGVTPDRTLKADLLQVHPEANPPQPSTFVTNNLNGSVLSFNDNDGRVWGIADIVKNISSQKVLAAPHIIATNNQNALISRTEKRYLKDQSTPSGDTTSISWAWQEAALSVSITPRINENDNVNLQITITVNNFKDVADSLDNAPIKLTRELTANTVVGNNNILILGGLVRLVDTKTTSQTPLLGKIPLLGWFFKNKSGSVAKTNLTIFIKPIVIKPRLRGGLQEHTQEFLGYIDNYTKGSNLFDSFKDPITKLFFSSGSETNKVVKDFLHFKEEEEAKSVGAPVQKIDLTEGIAQASKKEGQQKKEPNQQEENTFSQKGSENGSERADMAKELLKDTKNPLATQ